MKTQFNFITLLFIGVLFFASCNKKEDSPAPSPDVIESDGSGSEDTKIPVSTLESGITVPGASKEKGMPPSPNSNLDFQLNTSRTQALQNSGLSIEFSSTDNIAGAYLLFKDSDGNPSDSYFDLPASSFDNSRLSLKEVNKKAIGARLSQADFENEVNVNFTSSVPAGKFCYDICLYDASNNISQIQTVCVTVESWGGNSTITGVWKFVKEEGNDYKDTIPCSSSGNVIAEFTNYLGGRDWTLVLNSDGSYYEQYNDSLQYLDYTLTEANCTATYDTAQKENVKYSGNWAYDDSDNTITIVDFKLENFVDPSENENYDNGEVYMDKAKAEIIDGQLVLTDDTDGDAIKYFFTKE